MNCKTCNDSKMVYTVAYQPLSIPLELRNGTDPAPSSFSIEQVWSPCPDCNRAEAFIEPAPPVGK